ncbi:protein kinase domain-containing protein [Ditylenchus destructor]|uniref:Protein kinase domain-containing protein n=1 Tax=Ditylenchus destructor TaxID=166010 RepID=A0AAD4N393_9BILA|nr:protein kinase domain-containing protein [Ditylenchus destructor]
MHKFVPIKLPDMADITGAFTSLSKMAGEFGATRVKEKSQSSEDSDHQHIHKLPKDEEWRNGNFACTQNTYYDVNIDMEEFDEFCYNKKDLIGHGAFAIVYKGRYKVKNADVAIKAIAKKNIAKAKNLLTKEIRILKELSGLKHENLVSLLKCVETPTHVFLVMEYVQYLELTIQHFFVQIARAMEAMNHKGIVHRDLKPQNILLCNPNHHHANPLPTQLVVKLADFGFARVLTDGGMAGTLCGSPMYMAPEVIMSLQYCAKADLWSVGTIMYQCLVGKAPFVAQTPQALKNFYERHKDLQPNIPEYCSPALADLLLKLLKRNPRDRIEFNDFFTHPFLHMPLPTSPSKRILDQALSHQETYQPSSAQVKAKFPAFSPSSPRPSPSASRPIQEGGSAAPYHHRPYAPPAFINPGKIGSEGMGRQAPLRPPSAGSGSRIPPSYSSRQTPTETEFRKDGKTGNNAMMTDSSDFTFLPPLDKNRQDSASRLSNQAQHGLQHSNGSSTSSNMDNPVRQVQVHSSSSGANVRAVPVPSQRYAFAKMEERRRGSPRSPSQTFQSPPITETDKAVPQRTSTFEARIPSVEEINLPETQFVIREHPPPKVDGPPSRIRRNTINDLAGCTLTDKEPSLSNASSKHYAEQPSSSANTSIPKSATSAVPLSLVDTNLFEPTKLQPAVDNIRYQSASSSPQAGSSASAQVKIITNSALLGNKYSDKPSLLNDTKFSDDEEEEVNLDPIQLPFADNGVEDTNFMEECSMSQAVSPAGEDAAVRRMSTGGEDQASSAHQRHTPQTSQQVPDGEHNVFNAEPPPPPELEQETMMNAQHRQTLAKLRFVVELIEALINVADKQINNPIAMMMEGGTRKSRHQSAASDAHKRAEQLVLHVRALHVLSSALVMAQPRSQELASLGIPGPDPVAAVVSAEKIMYQHAIDLCQSAALDELFGNPQLCPKRYQTAYTMLHTLSEQVQNEQDKTVLAKYKNAVERRLRILTRIRHSYLNIHAVLSSNEPSRLKMYGLYGACNEAFNRRL